MTEMSREDTSLAPFILLKNEQFISILLPVKYFHIFIFLEYLLN